MRGVKKLGLVLIVLGLLSSALPTVGFEMITADRPTAVDTAPDPDALLGIVDNSANSGADVMPPGREGTVYYLDDNGGVDGVAPQATAVAFDGGSIDLEAQVQPATDHDYRIVVDCGDSTTGPTSGRLTVDITVGGDDVQIDLQRQTNETVFVNCHSSGGAGFASTSADSLVSFSDNTFEQTFTFEPDSALNPQSEVTIDVGGAQSGIVDYSNVADADIEVSGDGPNVGDAELVDDDTIVFTPSSAVTGEVRITLPNVVVEGSGTGASYDAEFTRTDTGDSETSSFVVFWWDLFSSSATSADMQGFSAQHSRTVRVSESELDRIETENVDEERIRELIRESDEVTVTGNGS